MLQILGPILYIQ